MNTAFQIVGAGVGLFAAIALAALFIYCILEVRERRANRIRGHAQTKAIREIGADIALGAHWYSENPEAMRLVECIGDYMMRRGVYREQYIRDLWRATKKGGSNARGD